MKLILMNKSFSFPSSKTKNMSQCITSAQSEIRKESRKL